MENTYSREDKNKLFEWTKSYDIDLDLLDIWCNSAPEINRLIREGKELNNDYRNVINLLNLVSFEHKAPCDIILYRRVSRIDDVETGDKINIETYMSASISKEFVNDAEDEFGSILMELYVPKNSYLLSINSSNFDEKSTEIDMYSDETVVPPCQLVCTQTDPHLKFTVKNIRKLILD